MTKPNTKQILEVLRELEKIDPNFPLKWAICFYEIAQNEGITIKELSEKTGYPMSTLSRVVAGLSCQKRYNKAALGLILAKINNKDNRMKTLTISKLGRQILKNIS